VVAALPLFWPFFRRKSRSDERARGLWLESGTVAPMRSNKDVESYLLRMGRPFKEADDGTFLVSVESVTVAVKVAPPLVLSRCEVGPVPAAKRELLFEHLLRLNATALVHGAYGLDGDRILLA